MRNIIKYSLIIVIAICMTGVGHAQKKVIIYEGGKKKIAIDSSKLQIKYDTVFTPNALGKMDTVINKIFLNLADSTSLGKDSIRVDTAFLKESALIAMEKKELFKKDTLRKPFNFFVDEIKPGSLTLLSFIPGVGQAYNRQFWKIPVIYGAMGGFITAGVVSNNRYMNYKRDWETSVNMHYPQAEQDLARGRMENEGATRTLFFSAAAAVYFYQIADATFNFRGKSDHIRKATTLAAVFPGAGFVYTKTYWRLPIYYGGFAVLASVIDFNNRLYVRYSDAYNALTDNDPTTVPFNPNASPQSLQSSRDFYRRNRDFGIIALVGAYILSIIDTHVIATLKNWDVSPDLSVTVEPTIINNSLHRASIVPAGAGVSLKIRF